jgi:hypothetical protein
LDAIVVVVIIIDIPNRILDYTRQICRFARHWKVYVGATDLHRRHGNSNEEISKSNVVGDSTTTRKVRLWHHQHAAELSCANAVMN